MPTPDEFELDTVDEEDVNTDSYDDMMDTEGVPYDEVFAAGPRGAREAVLREDIPEPGEVRDRYWDALDDMLSTEKQRLEGEYTLKEFLIHDADPATKALVVASAGVDSLGKMVEDAEAEDGGEKEGLAAVLGLRAANMGGAKALKRRYSTYVEKETKRYQAALDHLEQYRSPDEDA